MTVPIALIKDLKAGKVVPFIGAGVSIAIKRKEDTTQALFPSWKGFVEILAGKLEDKGKSADAGYIRSSVAISKPKYLEAMQHAKQELGDRDWYEAISENFDKLENQADQDSLKLAKLIWKLSNNLVITTNIDNTLRWTCPTPADLKTLDVQNVEYAGVQQESVPQRPTVWHLHGNVDHKEKVIFTLDQYNSFYKQHGNYAKLQTLINLLSNRTFLFIGSALMMLTCANSLNIFTVSIKELPIIFMSFYGRVRIIMQGCRVMSKQFPLLISESRLKS